MEESRKSNEGSRVLGDNMGKKAIVIEYHNGNTKTVYLDDIKKGRSVDPRLYADHAWIMKNGVRCIEEVNV